MVSMSIFLQLMHYAIEANMSRTDVRYAKEGLWSTFNNKISKHNNIGPFNNGKERLTQVT